MAIIEAVEDARVEELACRQFPKMRASWLALHPPADYSEPESVGDLLNRLARALLDTESDDPHPWVQAGVALFRAEEDLSSNQASWNIGVELAHKLAEIPLPEYSPRTDTLRALYRDDNRTVWES
jgi:hypothetical protein